jgi:peptidyl-prolyl cis-trans isomerase C
MSPAFQHSEPTPFHYHLLQNALAQFQKNLVQLTTEEYQVVLAKANKSFELENQVLASAEAEQVVIGSEQLDAAMAQLLERYESEADFDQDLAANGLDQEVMRQALFRELVFDGVLNRVSAGVVDVSDTDVRLFYELQQERFSKPERRTARHILITVNPEFPENTRDQALARMQAVMEKLNGRTNRFGQFAQQYSECPTAVESGKLGDVKLGQLYPELDQQLFQMAEGEISPILETEIGFHLLYCERIKAGSKEAFSKAAPRIRQHLEEKQQRSAQKSWLATLGGGK